MFAPAGGRLWRCPSLRNICGQLQNASGMSRTIVTARSTGHLTLQSLQTAKAMGIRQSSTVSPPESLTALFNDAEASFPPRFRDDGWYLTMVSWKPTTFVHCSIIVIIDNRDITKSLLIRSYAISGGVTHWKRSAEAGRSSVQAPRLSTAIPNVRDTTGACQTSERGNGEVYHPQRHPGRN